MRLGPEVIRDQALFVSGLLTENVGGPSVKPYQPAGLWQELSGNNGYVQSKGADLYRRSLYTYWKRTIPPPYMMNFDSPNREQCAVFENRTNSPFAGAGSDERGHVPGSVPQAGGADDDGRRHHT